MSTRAVVSQPDLHRFFQRCFHNKKWKPERFTVHHVVEGNDREQIFEITDFEEQGPEDFVTEVVDRCTNDAKGYPGTQTYAIRCFPENSRDAIDRERFQIEGALFDKYADSMSGPSEGPNERGLTGQLMRHLEAQARTYHSTYHSMMQTMRDMIIEQRQQISDMSRERLEVMRIAQDLLDRKQEREISLGREKIKDSFLHKGVEALNLAFPTIAFKMLGGKKENGANQQNGQQNGAAPQPESEGESGVKHFVAFVQDLSDEQKLQVFQLLGDGQKMAFGEIAQTYREKGGKMNTAEVIALDWAIHGLLKGLDERQMHVLLTGQTGEGPILNPEQVKAFAAIYEGYGIRDKQASLDQKPEEKKPEEKSRILAPDPPKEPEPVLATPFKPKKNQTRKS